MSATLASSLAPSTWTVDEASAFASLQCFVSHKDNRAPSALGLFFEGGRIVARGTIWQRLAALAFEILFSALWPAYFAKLQEANFRQAALISSRLQRAALLVEAALGRETPSGEQPLVDTARKTCTLYRQIMSRATALPATWQQRLLHNMGHNLSLPPALPPRPILLRQSVEEIPNASIYGTPHDLSDDETLPLPVETLSEHVNRALRSHLAPTPPESAYQVVFEEAKLELTQVKDQTQFVEQARLLQRSFCHLSSDELTELGALAKRALADIASADQQGGKALKAHQHIETLFEILITFAKKHPHQCADALATYQVSFDLYSLFVDLLLYRLLRELKYPSPLFSAVITSIRIMPNTWRISTLEGGVRTFLSTLGPFAGTNDPFITQLAQLANELIPKIAAGYFGPKRPFRAQCHRLLDICQEYYRQLYRRDKEEVFGSTKQLLQEIITLFQIQESTH